MESDTGNGTVAPDTFKRLQESPSCPTPKRPLLDQQGEQGVSFSHYSETTSSHVWGIDGVQQQGEEMARDDNGDSQKWMQQRRMHTRVGEEFQVTIPPLTETSNILPQTASGIMGSNDVHCSENNENIMYGGASEKRTGPPLQSTSHAPFGNEADLAKWMRNRRTKTRLGEEYQAVKLPEVGEKPVDEAELMVSQQMEEEEEKDIF
mmetsp:Transcript_26242/g.41241  ORF Transcript_26242/g.41241 Transcript_26242/m.41241 type:complete len:206 (-) Transcript_26242:189-806(-)|eukprot:CAMPEP_0194585142 /NCGR_PEP_ID=MMETSP0292-20121207/17552_1 /TAXON_ID=39354 /ORGANISM="Heterosigma akashiwo, Strain CCMP2393" /LENGTH=205 /DNA_ID=CAMNT_0039440485 /DNA_START=142 /DNA_END=759 /DNA_ORIENTATION=-